MVGAGQAHSPDRVSTSSGEQAASEDAKPRLRRAASIIGARSSGLVRVVSCERCAKFGATGVIKA
jgi:hypothetical protein